MGEVKFIIWSQQTASMRQHKSLSNYAHSVMNLLKYFFSKTHDPAANKVNYHQDEEGENTYQMSCTSMNYSAKGLWS